ncbi:transcription factor BIM1 [Actinidia eriantha]|uniref:transcription factor BIM1 n=1 Tax=Actinidia eriantha TaxID=165200 RepID=UPI00258D33D2|nr:transcription factor BIM1 [Actinidia eriantha]XP_057459884.1 transcription factor BIM1 [Actinidia eriantha]
MELPQPRPFEDEGRKWTHDFLSLCSPVQDPRPSQGGYLQTHDFLQPLEGLGKSNTKEESIVEIPTPEKPLLPAPPSSGEHILPGGIGTYSISHISYFNQRALKPEGGTFTVAQSSSTDRNEENSNCSSYTGSGFTVWAESTVKKGKTGKENVAGDRHVSREAGVKTGVGGQWMTSERPSQSSSNNTTMTTNHRNATTTFSSLSSSQPPMSQKNQTFMDMLKSAKVTHDEDDDEEEDFVLKKEPSPYLRSDLTVKVGGVGGKINDQKPNTPRSKHSATEQRRRSKINDRFQMLRELIPHGDQKRDKASFLLEVIEYIQYLQEKVHKYEGSYQAWDQEPPKLTPWRNSHRHADGFVDQSRATNSGSGAPLVFPAKFDENNFNVSSPTNPRNGQNAVECDMRNVTTLKAMDHHPVLTNKAVLLPLSLQSNIFTPSGSGNAIAPIQARVVSDIENATSQPQYQFLQSRSRTIDCAVVSNKLKEQELTIESGKICISSVYSQGLLNTLTQALQSSGIDLSQASISVQIDLGKLANSKTIASTSTVKDNDIHSSCPAKACSRGSIRDESDQTLKRLKTS